MLDFGIHFLICNIFISIFIGIMTGIKHLLRKCLSARMQYRLWFLLLGFMAVPFLPANIFSILQKFPALHLSDFPKRLFLSVPDGQVFIKEHSAIEKVNDFAVSISSKTSSPVHFMGCRCCHNVRFSCTFFFKAPHFGTICTAITKSTSKTAL